MKGKGYNRRKESTHIDTCPACQEGTVRMTLKVFNYGVRRHQSPCTKCGWLPLVIVPHNKGTKRTKL